MNVRFTLEARRHISEIYIYIEGRNPPAASRVVVALRVAARLIGLFPHIGRVGRARSTYELSVKGLPYIIVYELRRKGKEVWILGIFHGAQDR